MNHRQSLIDNRGCVKLCLNDPLKAFVAGKIMATAAFLCMDISPWRLTATYPRRRLSLDVDKNKGMIEYYSFPISCVFACVDYLSHDDKHSALLCHLYSIVTILCNQLTVTVRSGVVHPSINRVAVEGAAIYMPVLMGCFRRHVDARDDATSHALLKLILCAMRSLGIFLGTRRQRQVPVNVIATPFPTEGSARDAVANTCDDFFDDLDDSIFASIETAVAAPESMILTNQNPEPYWKCMKDVLVMLRVSYD